jgi:predicted HAD superfamily Cof-like phosphohydrolase
MNQVAEFHRIAELSIETRPTGFDLVEPRTRLRRKNLILEEVIEYVESEARNNIVEIADALGDLIYVIVGCALEYGIPLEGIVDEIHRSNMTKFPDGKCIRREEDGKILKPDTWEPPRIAQVLEYGSLDDE